MLLDPVEVWANLGLRRVTESENCTSGIQHGCMETGLILDPEHIWILILGLLFPVCVILDSLLKLSGSQVSLLENKESDF